MSTTTKRSQLHERMLDNSHVALKPGWVIARVRPDDHYELLYRGSNSMAEFDSVAKFDNGFSINQIIECCCTLARVKLIK